MLSEPENEKREMREERANEKESPELITRRSFLNKVSLGVGALAAAIVGLPVIGFLFAPLFKKAPEEWRAVGPVSQFQVGKTVKVDFQDASPEPWAGVTALTAAWLRRESESKFAAFSVNCTHLGCPVNWLADAELFMCPCHGGVYYQDGRVAAGPPPRRLFQYDVRVNSSTGQVEVRTAPIPIG